MRIVCLGSGAWGTALAIHLSKIGHEVTVWGRNPLFLRELDQSRLHPKFKFVIPKDIRYEGDLEKALKDAEMIVESISSAGIRPLFEKIEKPSCPIVLTSKGIEQKTDLLLPEVLLEILGSPKFIGCLSGPSYAEEVVKELPTSLVASAFEKETMVAIQKAFNAPAFRIYANSDILGVSFGGAMKNVIAIACGISDGLGFGHNAKAAIMTRGLHEIRKLSVIKGAKTETLFGLSGLGDLFLTCSSSLSRNYTFGKLIAEGLSPQEAKEKIGMVVEGAYTCVSARELAIRYDIPAPITEATYAVIYEKIHPSNAVKLLLQREIKEEHL